MGGVGMASGAAAVLGAESFPRFSFCSFKRPARAALTTPARRLFDASLSFLRQSSAMKLRRGLADDAPGL
jgi:hypothetical protein